MYYFLVFICRDDVAFDTATSGEDDRGLAPAAVGGIVGGILGLLFIILLVIILYVLYGGHRKYKARQSLITLLTCSLIVQAMHVVP